MNSNGFVIAVLALLFGFILGVPGAIAAGSHGGGHGHKTGHGQAMKIGEPGDPAQVDRTIMVIMGDNFFEPNQIKLGRGETIRFMVRNSGEFLHEFNIGTSAMHAAHQKEMSEMMEHGMITSDGINHERMKMGRGADGMMMAHDDPNSVLLEPGKQAEVIWHFTTEVILEFACNVPGHYESGMMGRIHMGRGG